MATIITVGGNQAYHKPKKPICRLLGNLPMYGRRLSHSELGCESHGLHLK